MCTWFIGDPLEILVRGDEILKKWVFRKVFCIEHSKLFLHIHFMFYVDSLVGKDEMLEK